jgi:methyltransferase (TIGR00027 family)
MNDDAASLITTTALAPGVPCFGIAMPICHVSDTAHWVAMYRAFESERPDALFHDPYARRMAGDHGASIARELPELSFGSSVAWAVVVRTAVMDELILDCIRRGAGCVLNLGAGLDTRAYRLPLPPELHWLDVDLPEMVAYRRNCLRSATPACVHAHLAADVTDARALDKLLATTAKVDAPLLVVSEGLLVYLAPAQVSALATRLNAQAGLGLRWWLTDLVSPLLLDLVGARWPSGEAAASAPFRFAPADSAAFFEPLGWTEEVYRSTLDEAVRLNRAPVMTQWFSSFALPWWPAGQHSVRRMCGTALLRPAGVGTHKA